MDSTSIRPVWLALLSLAICAQLPADPPKAIPESLLAKRVEKAARPLRFVDSDIEYDRVYEEAREAISAELENTRIRRTMKISRISWKDGVATFLAGSPKLPAGKRPLTRLQTSGRFDVLMTEDEAASIRKGTRLRLDAILTRPAKPTLAESGEGAGQYIASIGLAHRSPVSSRTWRLFTTDYRLWHGSEELVPKWRGESSLLMPQPGEEGSPARQDPQDNVR